jgi:hypothetical protein
MSWTTLPDGSSILFRDLEEKDTHERYRGFHLYKAIARFCKDAVPRNEIGDLKMFKVDSVPAGTSVCSIDA